MECKGGVKRRGSRPQGDLACAGSCGMVYALSTHTKHSSLVHPEGDPQTWGDVNDWDCILDRQIWQQWGSDLKRVYLNQSLNKKRPAEDLQPETTG